MTFQGRDPANFADDERIGRKTEALAQSGIVAGCNERLQGETAKHTSVHFRMADTGSEVTARHGIGRAEEMSRVTGGELFGGAENEIGQRSLKGTEGGAMDVVDDHGNPGAMGGDTAENSGFSAVGMDDVRAAFAEKLCELPRGA